MNNNLKLHISLVFAMKSSSDKLGPLDSIKDAFCLRTKLYMVGSEQLCRSRRYRLRRMTPSTICSVFSDHTTAESNNFLILSEKDRCRYKVWQAFEKEGEVNLGAKPRFRNPLPFSFERLPCTARLIT